MDRYERAFHKLLRHMGKDVMVTKRMKQYDSNNKIIVDNKGQPEYTETTNHCLAQIDLVKVQKDTLKDSSSNPAMQ